MILRMNPHISLDNPISIIFDFPFIGSIMLNRVRVSSFFVVSWDFSTIRWCKKHGMWKHRIRPAATASNIHQDSCILSHGRPADLVPVIVPTWGVVGYNWWLLEIQLNYGKSIRYVGCIFGISIYIYVYIYFLICLYLCLIYIYLLFIFIFLNIFIFNYFSLCIYTYKII